MDKQVFIGGYGHSGTRVASMILEKAGYCIGKNRNQVYDVTDFKRICYGYERKYRRLYLKELIEDKGAVARFRKIVKTNVRGKKFWALKYGTFFRILPLVFQAYPEAKFVMMVRHGMDQIFRFPKWAANSKGFNVETVLDTKELGQERHRRQLLFWGRLYREAIDYLKATKKKNWIVIRLEDLCADPPTEIDRLFSFLKIEGKKKKRCAGLVRHPPTIGTRFRKKEIVKKLEGYDYGMLEYFDYEF